MKRTKILFLLMIYVATILVSNVNLVLADGNEFKDVKPSHWAYQDIMKFKELGIFKGVNGEFLPQKTISEAEFVTALVRAMGIYHSEKNLINFNELQQQSLNAKNWYDPYMNLASKLKIMGSVSNNIRYDKVSITRDEVAELIINAFLGENPTNPYMNSENELIYKNMTRGNKGYLKKIFNYGIMSGYPNGEFYGNKYLTREEACAILNRFVFEDKRKYPKPIDMPEAKLKVVKPSVDEPNVYFDIVLENYNEFNANSDRIKYDIKCINYPELNKGYYFFDDRGNWWANWEANVKDKEIANSGLAKEKLLVFHKDFYTTKENMKAIKITQGMKLQYRITFYKEMYDNGKLVKTISKPYDLEVTINDKWLTQNPSKGQVGYFDITQAMNILAKKREANLIARGAGLSANFFYEDDLTDLAKERAKYSYEKKDYKLGSYKYKDFMLDYFMVALDYGNKYGNEGEYVIRGNGNLEKELTDLFELEETLNSSIDGLYKIDPIHIGIAIYGKPDDYVIVAHTRLKF